MNTRSTRRPNFFVSQTGLLSISIFIAIAALVIFPLFTVSSASSSHRASVVSAPDVLAPAAVSSVEREAGKNLSPVPFGLSLGAFSPTAFMPQASVETVAIYQADCTTPASAFTIGQTAQMCAKLTNAPLGLRSTQVQRRLVIVGPGGYIRSKMDVSGLSTTATLLFTIPATATTLVGGETVDNRGEWQAASISTRDGSARAAASFTVSDPAQPVGTLYLVKVVSSTEVDAGGYATFKLLLVNFGPDAAANVEVTDAIPANTTFYSESHSDAGFTCQNPAVGAGPAAGAPGRTSCTIASLPKGAKVSFLLTYLVDAGAPVKTVIDNSASVSTTTAQRSTRDNFSEAVAIVTGTDTDGGCTLTCPGNVTVTANATQGGEPGRFVTFSAASVLGTCGAVSNTPASGSFFTVSGSPHTVTSSSEAGPSCTFTVTVLDSTEPTISCPANKVVTAPIGTEEASVDPGVPTTNVVNPTIVGVRSDGSPAVYDDDGNLVTPAVVVPLNAPYPVGVTGILWTVTDSSGRTASCQQTIKVNAVCGQDTESPTIEAPPNITVGTGPDNTGCVVALDDELGQATAHDNCTATITVSGIPANNEFAPGVYTITYTATDAAGHSASDTQTVTVVDDTPPKIAAPANATYTCMSEVPAASPSQATRGVVLDEDGNPLPPGPPFDNCGVPTVTVSETSTGAGSAADPKIITRVFTATDSSPAHNSSSATQIITVIDSTPPTITAPLDVAVNTGAGAASCDTVVSNATLGTASASDNCAGVNVARSPAGNTFAVGTTDVIWTATDAAGNTATATQHVTVNDNTVPTITAPANKTLYTGAGATSCDVTVSDLDTTLGTATAADNCPGVTWARGGGNVFPLGATTVTYTATDAHGNTASANQTVTVVDNTPPVVTAPANIVVNLPLNSTATSMAVSYPNPATATDNCAGTITFNYSPASGSTFPVGTTTVTVTATDAHSNSATATFTVTVLYNFTGFFSPVSNLPTLNSVNAGRAIPVKFSLSGNKGLNIFAPDNPYSVSFNCDTNDPGVDVIETLNAGGSSLSYGGDQYIYVWKTESSWVGTCRQLVITLNDGSVHVANFKFK